MSLEDTAYTYIKDKIQALEWLPGYQIRENDIASSLNISRTPIRKAFNHLISDGYIEKINNKGVFVSEGALTKKEFQERLEFIEILLIDYLQELQRKEYDFQNDQLSESLDLMKAEVEGSNVDFLNAERKYWHHLLKHHENTYEKGLIIRTFNQIFSQSGYIEEVLAGSRKDKYIHMDKLQKYLGDNNYPYARREIRILFNQLVLNIFQGPKNMYNR